MKKKRHISIIFFCFLMIFGCKDFQEVKVLGVQGFKVEKLSMSGIEAEVMIGIKNPNDMGFTVYPSEFDIIIGGVNLGKARLYKKVKIEGGCEKAYPFKLKSDFKGMDLMELSSII